ncbi:MAG: hypothetical protein FWB90_09275, partial [Fibromonadales bacterium]|nr:hypothetical protein [Fibromonadales bacterium]
MKTNFFSLTMSVSLLAFGFSLISCGPSKAVLAIQAAASIEEVQGLENKLIWLQANAKPDGNYIIEIDSDEKITGSGRSCSELRKGTITLRGVGANRTISHASDLFGGCPHSMFYVGNGATLVLDNNITLKTGHCSMTMVVVSERGTLVMNEGSAIIGGRNQNGGGIYVGDGTFLIKGGTIYGNTSRRPYTVGGGQSAGKYFVRPNESIGGGGVWVSPNGTFIKTGGTITNNSVEDIRREFLFKYEDSYGRVDTDRMEIRIPADEKKGPELSMAKGQIKTGGGRKFIQEQGYAPVNGFGSQIYFDGKNPRAIDDAVG